MYNIFQPKKIINILGQILPVTIFLAIITLSIGIMLIFYHVPADYQQGEAVKIMYVHVPAAWMAMLIYSVIFFSSIGSIIWKNPICDLIAMNIAPIGAVFALITLVTGSLWGKPIWGTWWVWDARLTSMLILFLIYLGYIVLVNSFTTPLLASKPAAILAIIGFINIPIVKFSVDFWNTLHQPSSILKLSGPSIHKSMLQPLFIIFAFCIFFTISVLALKVQTSINITKLQRWQKFTNYS